MVKWISEFLSDYIPWTLVDLLVYTRKGHVILSVIVFGGGGTVLSGVGYLVAPLYEPTWRPELLTVLICFLAVAIIGSSVAAIEAYGPPSRPTVITSLLFLVTWFLLARLYRTETLLRADVDHYAMPRHLEADKAGLISKYLKGFPPHTVTVCSDIYDSEASGYATEIETALIQGKWKLIPCNLGLESMMPELFNYKKNPVDSSVTYGQLRNFLYGIVGMQTRCEGLGIDVQRSSERNTEVNNRTDTDPQNPDTDVLLRDALKQGGINNPRSGCGNLAPLGTKDEIVTLTVGPKPRLYSPRTKSVEEPVE